MHKYPAGYSPPHETSEAEVEVVVPQVVAWLFWWLVVCFACSPWLGFEGRVMTKVGCLGDDDDDDGLGLVVDHG